VKDGKLALRVAIAIAVAQTLVLLAHLPAWIVIVLGAFGVGFSTVSASQAALNLVRSKARLREAKRREAEAYALYLEKVQRLEKAEANLAQAIQLRQKTVERRPN
jgi:hypothetical protein